MSEQYRSPKELKEHRFLESLLRLPLGILLRAFRQKPVIKDGQTLHPEMQAILLLRKMKKSPGMGDRPPLASRKALRRDARVHGYRTANEIATIEHNIPTDDGSLIKARLYKPNGLGKDPGPLLVFFHGGGFVLGDIESYDPVCRFVCDKAQIRLLSVDYRLAPEFPFPTGLSDSIAAYRWAYSNAELLGANPYSIAVGGDSAGANFAAHIAQITAVEGKAQPLYQWLIYPTLDRSRAYPSAQLFADGFFLRAKDLAYFNEHYGATDPHDVRVSIINGPRLSGLARTLVVTAGFDPLRDEGEAYAEALRRAGTRVDLIRFPGLIHGFINMIGLSPEAKRSFGEAVNHLKGAMHV